MDDDLFGDIVVGTVTRSSRRPDPVQQRIQTAWNLWSELTDRPPSRDPDGDFSTAYRRMLDSGWSNDSLMRCVHAAARVQPVITRDPRDVKRVVRVLTRAGYEAEAMELYHAQAPVIPYPRADNVELKSAMRDVSRATGTPISDWPASEREVAGVLMTQLDAAQLSAAAKRVKLLMGEDAILPSDMIRRAAVWRNVPDGAKVQVAVNASRDPYAGGKNENDLLEGTRMDADSGAMKLMTRGCPIELVVEYHGEAPQGYWSAVLKRIDEDLDLDRADVYTELEEQWKWHPSRREMPRW